MKRKFFSIMLCLGMFVGLLSGCGSNDSTDSTADSSAATEEQAEASSEDAESGGTEEVTTLSIFVNFSWYPVDSFTGKIPEAITEATGVDLDVTIATDSTQLGVMIASGELPDLIFTDDTGSNLTPLSNSDICYSLDELTELTGISFEESENYEERYKIAQSFSSDEQAYTLLNNYNTQEDWENLQLGAPGMACVYYRKDLLEAAGIEEPGNLEEFYECLGQVKEAYPDMTPLGLGGYWKTQAFATWFGVSADQYDPDTGEYVYDTSTESYREFLEYFNSLYRAGYISAQDYAVENEADGHQMAYNDGCVFYTWYLSNSNMTQLQTNAVSETAEWAVLNPLGEAPVGEGKGWAGVFVSRNCEELEAAARIASYLNTPEGGRLSMWGVEGEDYTLDENGVPEFSEEFLAAREDTNTWYTEYNTMFYFGASAITEVYMNYSGMDEETLAQFTAHGEGYKNYAEIGIATPLSTSDEGVIFTKLEELRENYEAQIIFTDTDEAFESAYNELMSAMEQTGVETYETYMTNRIVEVKEEFGF